MSQSNHQDSIITARDTLFGDDDERARGGVALPVSQDEVDELLYTEGLTHGVRLDRLRQLREQMVAVGSADVIGNDAAGLAGEIERAISELERLPGEGMDPASVDHNPEDHRETLSPDDDDLLDLLAEEEDEANLFDVLDPKEWEDGDGFDGGKGVH